MTYYLIISIPLTDKLVKDRDIDTEIISFEPVEKEVVYSTSFNDSLENSNVRTSLLLYCS